MLPKELGGVVDPNLRVYGLANVRVADASVFPIEFAAHVGDFLVYTSFAELLTNGNAHFYSCKRLHTV
jgi:hypothetical protein